MSATSEAGPWARAVALIRRRPALVMGWLVLLILPALIGLFPLGAMLAPHLDLRPAADAIMRAPADDGLLVELLRLMPEVRGVATTGFVLTLLIGVPALWLFAGHVAAAALDSTAPAGAVAARSIAIALTTLPLRALPALAAVAIGIGAVHEKTLARMVPSFAVAFVVYLLTSSAITVLVDLARGAALADLECGLLVSVAAAARAARRQWRLYLGLCALELGLALVALLPSALSRPLLVLPGWTPLLAYLALALRSAGSVLGVATATGAASRSG
jgi:hypothetical protein